MLFRLVISIVLICCTYLHLLAQKKEINQFKKEHKDFIYVPASVFMMGNMPEVHLIPADSNLQLIYDRRLECVDGFLMSDHEVTNNEYREFVNYVKDSVMRAALAVKFPEFYLNGKTGKLNFEKVIDWESEGIFSLINEVFYGGVPEQKYYARPEFFTEKLIYSYDNGRNGINSVSIYPDTTLVWSLRGYDYISYFSDAYFWHPAYGDFPILGLSYDQVLAYVHWKTVEWQRQFPDLKLEVDLPSEVEWECAALLNGPPDTDIFYRDIPCSMEKYAVYSNFVYEHGKWEGDYCGSSAEFVQEVRSKEKGFKGFYDLGGNVAEFVKVTPSNCEMETEKYGHNWYQKPFPNLSFSIDENDNLESTKLKILIANADTLYSVNTKWLNRDLQEMAAVLLHDTQVRKKIDEYIVLRGGSWLSPIHHCLPQARVLVDKSHADLATGFRIVIHAPQEVLMAFIEKEKRKRSLTAEEHFELDNEY